MTVDMQITDYQRRIVWLVGANDPQKATRQITQYHVRMMLTATVATEAYVVYCTDTCAIIWSLIFGQQRDILKPDLNSCRF